MLGNFSCFCCRLLTFFKNGLFQKNLSGTLIRVSNCLDPDQDRQNVGPDLGPDCLAVCKDYQQTTKVAASMEKVNMHFECVICIDLMICVK